MTRQAENSSVIMNKSRISITLHGFLDTDLRDFSDSVRHSLPGHISLREIRIDRLATPTRDQLASISRGGGEDLVRATLVLQWRVTQLPDKAAGL